MENRDKQEALRKKKMELRGLYRHIKGELYVVVDVGIHSETEEYFVIYKSYKNPDLVWCQPMDNFLADADYKKQENSAQQKKFVKIRSI